MPTSSQMILPNTKSPSEFESICKDILNVKCGLTFDSEFAKYGRSGQTQKGIDLYVQHHDGLIVAQCKNYTTSTTKKKLITKIQTDVASIAERGDVKSVFILTAHRTDNDVQEAIIKLNQTYKDKFDITGVFWDDIEEIIWANNFLLLQHFPSFAHLVGSLTLYRPEVYRAKSREQFEGWKATQDKLHNILHDDNAYIPMVIKHDKNECTVEVVLDRLKEKDCPHAILSGEGGMGKTMTCMRLWDIILKQDKQVFYMPLCDYTTDNAIQKNIVDVYGVESDNYNRLMDNEEIVLLLDGFNEMKNELESAFLAELKELVAKKRLQIFITSRNDVLISKTSWFTRLTFKLLSKVLVDEWLEKHVPTNKKTAITPELYDVLINPMLLKIYVLNINEPETIDNLQKTNFLKAPITTGEIIWNFLEHQIIKSDAHEEHKGFTKILYRYLLPYIAYKIESQGNFNFTVAELEKYIDEFVEYIKGLNEKLRI